MSTPESQLLRDGIRNGQIRCRRPAEGGQCNPHIGDHERGCAWSSAVIRIYELERDSERADSAPHSGSVDWPAVISRLRRAGFSYRTAGEVAGVPHSLLHEYSQGVKSPNHDNGEKIIALWCQVTSSDRGLLPRAPTASAAHFR